MEIHEKLERVGRILVLGFADRIAIGVFLSFLEEVSPDEAYDYIKNNRSRVDELPDEDWADLHSYAENLNKFPSTDDILKALQKKRPELASIVLNSSNGRVWLESEVQKAKGKLGL